MFEHDKEDAEGVINVGLTRWAKLPAQW